VTFLKFVKIREFYELLKFIKFEFSIYDLKVTAETRGLLFVDTVYVC